MARILVVDDEPAILSFLGTLLGRDGYDVVRALGGEKAQEELRKGAFDLMITDYMMSPIDGMALLQIAGREYPNMPTVVISGHCTVQNAIEVLRAGAFDYLPKPVGVDDLRQIIRRALEYHDVLERRQSRRIRLGPGGLVVESPAMARAVEIIERVIPADSPVLVCGEQGAGKERIARTIHEQGPRRSRPFVVVDCAMRPEKDLALHLFGGSPDVTGQLDVAREGTVYLAEIASLPLALQDRLAAALAGAGSQAHARIIAGSMQELDARVEQGALRPALYQRFSIFTVTLPPLRERPQDVLGMAAEFLRGRSGPPGLDSDVELVLEHYPWPGNGDELLQAMEEACGRAGGGAITMASLPPRIANAIDLAALKERRKSMLADYKGQALKSFLRSKEKEYLAAVLSSANKLQPIDGAIAGADGLKRRLSSEAR